MGKRLMLILACALVVGLVIPAFAEVQNVKVSGDLSALGISRSNFNLGNINESDDKESHAASIVRVRIDADLTENVGTTIRLLSERDWAVEAANTNEIDVDLAYVTLKEFLYSPLTLTIGRQELQFGNGFIIGDPDTNNTVAGGNNLTDEDLSARKAFDAVRATFNYDPLILDMFWSKIQENTVLGAAAANANEKDDVDLFGVNARYDFGGNWKTIGEMYWFRKVDRTGRDTNAANSKKIDINNVGARVDVSPTEKLNLQAEGAVQFGRNTNAATATPQQDHKAWAAQGIASYALDMKYSPVLSATYSMFSGDKNGNTNLGTSGSSNAWDPMFENQTSGHIANVLFNATNSQVVDLAVSIKPIEDMTMKVDYVWLGLMKTIANGGTIQTFTQNRTAVNHVNTTGKDSLGSEVDLTLTYDYTEDVQLGLIAGMFNTGAAFDETDTASEVIASVKVSF